MTLLQIRMSTRVFLFNKLSIGELLQEGKERYKDEYDKKFLVTKPKRIAKSLFGGEASFNAALDEGECWINSEDENLVSWKEKEAGTNQGKRDYCKGASTKVQFKFKFKCELHFQCFPKFQERPRRASVMFRVYVFVFIHIYIHTYTHTHIYACEYTCMNAQI